MATVAAVVTACGSDALPFATPTPTPARPANRTSMVIAVVGDMGACATACVHEQAVADMVHSWVPDYVVDLGDSAYSPNQPAQVLADMRPYLEDVAARRFLGVLGNDDYGRGCDPSAAEPVKEALGIADHDVRHLGDGLVDLYLANTTCGSASGYRATSAQASEYRRALGASTARWRITAGHHPPWSSGSAGSLAAIRWLVRPGVDLFLAGHDHDFEHLVIDGQNFVVAGAGGQSFTPACPHGCLPGSVWHDGAHFGAVRLTIDADTLRVDFVAVGGRVLHSFTVQHPSGG